MGNRISIFSRLFIDASNNFLSQGSRRKENIKLYETSDDKATYDFEILCELSSINRDTLGPSDLVDLLHLTDEHFLTRLEFFFLALS